MLHGLVVALAAALPFEVIRAPFSLGRLPLTNLTLLALGVAAVGLICLVAGGSRRGFGLRGWVRQRPIVVPALLWLALGVVSALAAPSHRADALAFMARLGLGLGVMLLALAVATSPARVVTLLWGIVLGAGLSALVGLGEALDRAALRPLLDLFAVGPARVGGELRVSATLHYPTIAAMYFELAAPVAIVLAAIAGSRPARALALGIALLCAAADLLTLTRAGLVALGAALALLLLLAFRLPACRPLARPTAVAALGLLLLVAGLAAVSPGFRLRLMTENDLTWYRAVYSVPADLALRPGETAWVEVEARNAGEVTWRAEGEAPFALGSYWLSADGRLSLPYRNPDVRLPRDVAPGETVRLSVPVVAAPPPGAYRLAFGMLRQGSFWFRERGDLEAETPVRIEPGPASRPPSGTSTPLSPASTADAPSPPPVSRLPVVPRDHQTVPPTAPRATLWPIALRMFAERPLLGVGPDNFRLLWGAYLGLPVWDTGLHSNNLYLELLADFGLPGALACLWLLWLPLRRAVGALRAAPPARGAVPLAGLTASLAAFLVHGLFDYFLEFLSVNLLLWLILGLMVAIPPAAGSRPAPAPRSRPVSDARSPRAGA